MNNSHLFPKTYKNSSHLQRNPEWWESATDDEHLEAMNIEVTRVNPMWMSYLQRKRPHLVSHHLGNCRRRRFYPGIYLDSGTISTYLETLAISSKTA